MVKYKALEPTQVIQKGDEWFDEEDGIWREVKTTIGKRVCDLVRNAKYRRKVVEGYKG